MDDGLAVLDWVKKELGGSASQVGLQLSTFGDISNKSRTFQTSRRHFRQVLDISDNSHLLGTFQTSLGHFRQVLDISDKLFFDFEDYS